MIELIYLVIALSLIKIGELILNIFFEKFNKEMLRFKNLDTEISMLRRQLSLMESDGTEATQYGDKFLVKYTLNGQTFFALLPYKHDVINPKFNITTGDGTDVTKNILKFIGPNFDFYKSSIKVSDTGYDSLIFHKLDKNPTIFKANDLLPIDLSEFNWNCSSKRNN
jgi:hypothetical protein